MPVGSPRATAQGLPACMGCWKCDVEVRDEGACRQQSRVEWEQEVHKSLFDAVCPADPTHGQNSRRLDQSSSLFFLQLSHFSLSSVSRITTLRLSWRRHPRTRKPSIQRHSYVYGYSTPRYAMRQTRVGLGSRFCAKTRHRRDFLQRVSMGRAPTCVPLTSVCLFLIFTADQSSSVFFLPLPQFFLSSVIGIASRLGYRTRKPSIRRRSLPVPSKASCLRAPEHCCHRQP